MPCLSTRCVLTVATQFDLVPRLLAVFTAILPERSLRLDRAVACRVGAFGRGSSHNHPRTGGLYASRGPWTSSTWGLAIRAGKLPHPHAHSGVACHLATDQDLCTLAAIRSTERGVMQVGLMRVRRGSPHLTSHCDGAYGYGAYGYLAAQDVWRYAASLAGSAARIYRSANE